MSYAQTRLQASADQTALMYAALSGRTSKVKALLKGTDVNAYDHEGRTALMFATINLHSETVNTLLEHGADVNAIANDGCTALMLAVCAGAIDIAESLLNRGADVDGRFAMNSRTPLAIATEHGYAEIVELLETSGGQDHRRPLTPPVSVPPPPLSLSASVGSVQSGSDLF